MATIVHLIVALILAVLRAFAGALVTLFSRAALGLGGVVGIVLLVLGATGTAGAAIRRRRN